MRGDKVHSLAKQLVGDLNIWNRDLDVMAPQILLQALVRRTGTSYQTALLTSHRSLEGILFETAAADRQNFMIRPVGVYHRTRRNHGEQYCPICLEQNTPYFRRNWRLKLFPVCTSHGILLRDACPDCDAPIIPFRGGLTSCHICKAQLSKVPKKFASASVIQLQRHNERVIEGSPVSWPYMCGTHPLAYFELLAILFQLVSANPRADRLARQISGSQQMPTLKFRDEQQHSRSMTSESAHTCMILVEKLLRGWPSMFAGYCADATLWESWTVRTGHGKSFPHTLLEASSIYLRPGSSPFLTEHQSSDGDASQRHL
jgi:TniQ